MRYVYDHDLLAESDGEAWAYHLNDGLGSARSGQLADAEGTVTLVQSYTPFGVPLASQGSGATRYGFTGERWEAYAELLFLRARYYEPGTGRFLQRDWWTGDDRRPQTLLQGYLYTMNNPVNAVDPSGWYHLDVHDGKTKGWVSEIAVSYGVSTVCGHGISELLAEANKRVDTHHTKLSSLVCRRCHFCPWADTVRHVDAAITSGNPYLFASSLHQVQDYFSHWAEGYDERGHKDDFLTAGGKPEQTSQRSPRQLSDFFEGKHKETAYGHPYWVNSPYPAHPEEEVRRFLERTNPNADVKGLDKDGLIDLYLRRDQGRDQSMRAYFGIDPDRYVPNSSRDNLMEWFTRYYIKKFMEKVAMSTCVIHCENDVDAIRKLLIE